MTIDLVLDIVKQMKEMREEINELKNEKEEKDAIIHRLKKKNEAITKKT